MLLVKHLDYLHMASHALGEFRRSDLSHNLWLTSTPRWVGPNLLRTFQVVQSVVAWDYHLLSHDVTTNLCLVQRFSALRTSPRAPPLKPSLVNTYVTHECCATRS